MQWFAAYEVVDGTGRRTLGIADTVALGDRAALLHARITAPRAPWTCGAQTLRFDQPLVAGILNVTPDSFSDGGRHVDDPAGALSLIHI